MLVVMTLITLAALQEDGVSMKFLPSGATAKVGGYRPVRAEMTDKGDEIKKAPEGLSAPKYGELKFGDKSWRFILDEPEGKPARLFVDMGPKVAAFTKERGMPWPQVYEGKFWNTQLGELYEVNGIPFVLLVDGDTGEILGTARELRGPGLVDFIEKALTKKKGT